MCSNFFNHKEVLSGLFEHSGEDEVFLNVLQDAFRSEANGLMVYRCTRMLNNSLVVLTIQALAVF